MSTIKKVINNNEYEFVNHFRGNRSGFVHETKLYRNNVLIGEHKIQYYNRTWERYEYQSVMKSITRILLDSEFEDFKTKWKNYHDIKRLTKTKEEIMMQDFVEHKPVLYEELQELCTML